MPLTLAVGHKVSEEQNLFGPFSFSLHFSTDQVEIWCDVQANEH